MKSPKVGHDWAAFTFAGDKRSRTKIFENIMAENHPNLMKTVHIHKAAQISRRINSNPHLQSAARWRQKKNLESSKRKNCLCKNGRNLNKINSWLLIRNTGGQQAVTWHSQTTKRETLPTENCIHSKTSLDKSEIKTFPDKQRLREFTASMSALQEIVKDFTDFPGSLVVKNLPAKAGNMGSIPSPRENPNMPRSN